MEQSEFQFDLKLDPTQLDVECVRQAEAFYKWAQRSIDAKAEVDRLDLALEVTEAKLQAAVRKDPAAFNLDPDKVTEAAVKAAVQRSKKLVTAKETYLEAKKEAALLEKAVGAMEIKKRMLESLITLNGQQYFAGPDAPRNLVQEWNKFQKKSHNSATGRQKALMKKGKSK